MATGKSAGWVLKVLIIGTVAMPSVALACRCIDPSDQEAYRQAETVAYGTISSVARNAATGSMTYTVDIDKQWKRPTAARITVKSGTTCAYLAKVGEQHLLYLMRTKNGEFQTNKCKGNKSAASAKKALEFLGSKTV